MLGSIGLPITRSPGFDRGKITNSPILLHLSWDGQSQLFQLIIQTRTHENCSKIIYYGAPPDLPLNSISFPISSFFAPLP